MDDGRCLLDVISDPAALDEFLTLSDDEGVPGLAPGGSIQDGGGLGNLLFHGNNTGWSPAQSPHTQLFQFGNQSIPNQTLGTSLSNYTTPASSPGGFLGSPLPPSSSQGSSPLPVSTPVPSPHSTTRTTNQIVQQNTAASLVNRTSAQMVQIQNTALSAAQLLQLRQQQQLAAGKPQMQLASQSLPQQPQVARHSISQPQLAANIPGSAQQQAVLKQLQQQQLASGQATTTVQLSNGQQIRLTQAQLQQLQLQLQQQRQQQQQQQAGVVQNAAAAANIRGPSPVARIQLQSAGMQVNTSTARTLQQATPQTQQLIQGLPQQQSAPQAVVQTLPQQNAAVVPGLQQHTAIQGQPQVGAMLQQTPQVQVQQGQPAVVSTSLHQQVTAPQLQTANVNLQQVRPIMGQMQWQPQAAGGQVNIPTGTIIQTSGGNRFLISGPQIMSGQQINLANLQNLQVRQQLQVAQSAVSSLPVAQPVAQPSVAVANKPALATNQPNAPPNVNVLNYPTQIPQQILLQKGIGGVTNQNIILQTIPSNIIQVQQGGVAQTPRPVIMAAQPNSLALQQTQQPQQQLVVGPQQIPVNNVISQQQPTSSTAAAQVNPTAQATGQAVLNSVQIQNQLQNALNIQNQQVAQAKPGGVLVNINGKTVSLSIQQLQALQEQLKAQIQQGAIQAGQASIQQQAAAPAASINTAAPTALKTVVTQAHPVQTGPRFVQSNIGLAPQQITVSLATQPSTTRVVPSAAYNKPITTSQTISTPASAANNLHMSSSVVTTNAQGLISSANYSAQRLQQPLTGQTVHHPNSAAAQLQAASLRQQTSAAQAQNLFTLATAQANQRPMLTSQTRVYSTVAQPGLVPSLAVNSISSTTNIQQTTPVASSIAGASNMQLGNTTAINNMQQVNTVHHIPCSGPTPPPGAVVGQATSPADIFSRQQTMPTIGTSLSNGLPPQSQGATATPPQRPQNIQQTLEKIQVYLHQLTNISKRSETQEKLLKQLEYHRDRILADMAQKTGQMVQQQQQTTNVMLAQQGTSSTLGSSMPATSPVNHNLQGQPHLLTGSTPPAVIAGKQPPIPQLQTVSGLQSPAQVIGVAGGRVSVTMPSPQQVNLRPVTLQPSPVQVGQPGVLLQARTTLHSSVQPQAFPIQRPAQIQQTGGQQQMVVVGNGGHAGQQTVLLVQPQSSTVNQTLQLRTTTPTTGNTNLHRLAVKGVQSMTPAGQVPILPAPANAAASATGVPVNMVRFHLPEHVRQQLQTHIAKLTPEQQEIFKKQLPAMLLKIQQQQQQQQQQQGKPATTVTGTTVTLQSPAVNRSPQIVTVTSQAGSVVPTIFKRPAPITKTMLMHQQLTRDQAAATTPDTSTPYKNKRDACKRLLRYHVFSSPEPHPKKLKQEEDEFEETARSLLERKEQMLNKYCLLLYEDAMRCSPSAEMVMIERLFLQGEKDQLQSDKNLAKLNPEAFVPTPLVKKPEIKKESLSDLNSSIEIDVEVKDEENSWSEEQEQELDSDIVIKKEPKSPERLSNSGKMAIKDEPSSSPSQYVIERTAGLKFVIKNSPSYSNSPVHMPESLRDSDKDKRIKMELEIKKEPVSPAPSPSYSEELTDAEQEVLKIAKDMKRTAESVENKDTSVPFSTYGSDSFETHVSNGDGDSGEMDISNDSSSAHSQEEELVASSSEADSAVAGLLMYDSHLDVLETSNAADVVPPAGAKCSSVFGPGSGGEEELDFDNSTLFREEVETALNGLMLDMGVGENLFDDDNDAQTNAILDESGSDNAVSPDPETDDMDSERDTSQEEEPEMECSIRSLLSQPDDDVSNDMQAFEANYSFDMSADDSSEMEDDLDAAVRSILKY